MASGWRSWMPQGYRRRGIKRFLIKCAAASSGCCPLVLLLFLGQDQRCVSFSIRNTPQKKGLKMVNGKAAVSVARTYWIRWKIVSVPLLVRFQKPNTFNDRIPPLLRLCFIKEITEKKIWKTRLMLSLLLKKKNNAVPPLSKVIEYSVLCLFNYQLFPLTNAYQCLWSFFLYFFVPFFIICLFNLEQVLLWCWNFSF